MARHDIIRKAILDADTGDSAPLPLVRYPDTRKRAYKKSPVAIVPRKTPDTIVEVEAVATPMNMEDLFDMLPYPIDTHYDPSLARLLAKKKKERTTRRPWQR